jgi:hypothetical protein
MKRSDSAAPVVNLMGKGSKLRAEGHVSWAWSGPWISWPYVCENKGRACCSKGYHAERSTRTRPDPDLRMQ